MYFNSQQVLAVVDETEKRMAALRTIAEFEVRAKVRNALANASKRSIQVQFLENRNITKSILCKIVDELNECGYKAVYSEYERGYYRHIDIEIEAQINGDDNKANAK